jgi:hypothetical protein
MRIANRATYELSYSAQYRGRFVDTASGPPGQPGPVFYAFRRTSNRSGNMLPNQTAWSV